ncbi:MAG: hypothetical protein ACR2QB_05280 [Gammaproteobacteria bacterium]
MKPKIFIQTNDRQWLGALVSAYSLKRNASAPDSFDVEILHVKDFPFLAEREGQTFLRGGVERVWHMDDLQSFTPLRFLPPTLMQHQGRAVVIDPDVFAVGDINELLSLDMQGTAVMGRRRSAKAEKSRQIATSVMLMDCSRLKHWETEQEFGELFEFTRDYKDWIVLGHEAPENLGVLDDCWNDFDRLDSQTKLLHNTKRRTQPWKTGLPVDYTPADKLKKYPLLPQLNALRSKVFGQYGLLGRYQRHPDQNQEAFFFNLLRECLENGAVTEDLVREEMRRDHVRHDALELAQSAATAA